MPSPLDQPEEDTPQTRTPDDEPTSPKKSPLAIELPKPASEPTAEEPVQTLDVGGGDVVKLDKLGPMIINTDGVSSLGHTGPHEVDEELTSQTLSRIQNWQDLHPIEQERTVRLLVKKRNLVRMKKLDQEGEGAGEAKVSALQQDPAEGDNRK